MAEDWPSGVHRSHPAARGEQSRSCLPLRPLKISLWHLTAMAHSFSNCRDVHCILQVVWAFHLLSVLWCCTDVRWQALLLLSAGADAARGGRCFVQSTGTGYWRTAERGCSSPARLLQSGQPHGRPLCSLGQAGSPIPQYTPLLSRSAQKNLLLFVFISKTLINESLLQHGVVISKCTSATRYQT